MEENCFACGTVTAEYARLGMSPSGRNNAGQLGVGAQGDVLEPLPVQVRPHHSNHTANAEFEFLELPVQVLNGIFFAGLRCGNGVSHCDFVGCSSVGSCEFWCRACLWNQL